MKVPKISKYQVSDKVETYLSKKTHVSSSDLKNMLNTPQHYLYEKKKAEEEEKQHFVIGTAVHCMVLEPSSFEKRFFFLTQDMLPFPDSNFQKKANRDTRDQLVKLAATQGKQTLTEKQLEMITIMCKGIKANKNAMKLLEPCMTEQSFYSSLKVDDEFSLKCKIRPDAFSPTGKYYISVKTTRDASPIGFAKEAVNHGYQISEAFYMKNLWNCVDEQFKPHTGYFFAIENNPPYMCAVYDINPEGQYNRMSEFLEAGIHHVFMGLQRFKECKQTKKYPGYEIYTDRNDGILNLQLPAYAKYKANQTII